MPPMTDSKEGIDEGDGGKQICVIGTPNWLADVGGALGAAVVAIGADGAAVDVGSTLDDAYLASGSTGADEAGSAAKPGYGNCGRCAAVGRSRPSMAVRRCAMLVI